MFCVMYNLVKQTDLTFSDRKEKKRQLKNNILIKIISVTSALLLAFALASCSWKYGEKIDTDTESDESSAADTYTYEIIYDDEGKEIGQNVYDPDRVLLFTELWDRLGRVVDVHSFNSDGSADADEHYAYDGEGDTIKSCKTVKYHYSSETGELENYNESYFNSDRQITDSFSYNADGSLINIYKYAYDENGNKILEEFYGANYDLVSSVEYEYYDNDLVSKEINRGSSGKILAITMYEYDDDGVLTKQSECDSDGSVRSYCLYVYDENDELEEQIYIRDDNGEFFRYN